MTDGIDRRCDVGVKTDRQVLDARRTNGVPLDATVQVSVAGTLMLPIAALILLARGFRQCRAAGKRQWQASRGR